MGCLRSPLPGKEFRRASQRCPACDKEFGDGETPGGGCQNGRKPDRRSQSSPRGVILAAAPSLRLVDPGRHGQPAPLVKPGEQLRERGQGQLAANGWIDDEVEQSRPQTPLRKCGSQPQSQTTQQVEDVVLVDDADVPVSGLARMRRKLRRELMQVDRRLEAIPVASKTAGSQQAQFGTLEEANRRA